jgi:mannobiose 2-epimerase
MFDLLERHARDRVDGGYLEALTRSWGPLADTALSDKDLSVPKSMNTNLHVLEAYTTLLRVTGDSRVREALHDLLAVSLDHIVELRPFAHCELFFDMDWRSHVDTVSYGHDIEASWLLWDAWEALAAAGTVDRGLGERTREVALLLADAVREHGQDSDGGVVYEGTPDGVVNAQKHWWPQAEGVVGWLNAYQLSGREADRASALAAWGFIEAHVIDREHGEWFAELERDGSVRHGADGDVKIGPWKCPYHNARACLEVMRRVV